MTNSDVIYGILLETTNHWFSIERCVFVFDSKEFQAKELNDYIMDKAVYFISHLTSLHEKATSTDLLTNNLIRGIKQNHKHLVCFILCPNSESAQSIIEEYSSLVDQVVVLPCRYVSGLSSARQYLLSIHSIFFQKHYCRAIDKALSNIEYEPELIITHAPCIESVFFGNRIKKHYAGIPFYQFWSDPITVSGIMPNHIGIRRYPLLLVEQWLLNRCDRIIYGTKTLMDVQKAIFQRSSYKMAFIDLGYLCDEKTTVDAVLDTRKAIYAGNFFKGYRNVVPVVNAFSALDGFSLDIYGNGDLPEKYSANISFVGRVPPDELEKVKKKYGIHICILNHNCIQIPGKVFYDINSYSKIIIILDGEYAGEIKKYLDTYQRFVFCKNEEDDIKMAIKRACSFVIDKNRIDERYSPKKIGRDLLIGGLTN